MLVEWIAQHSQRASRWVVETCDDIVFTCKLQAYRFGVLRIGGFRTRDRITELVQALHDRIFIYGPAYEIRSRVRRMTVADRAKLTLVVGGSIAFGVLAIFGIAHALVGEKLSVGDAALLNAVERAYAEHQEPGMTISSEPKTGARLPWLVRGAPTVNAPSKSKENR